MKCLVPLITKSLPWRRARHFIPRRSDPASGSLMARHSVRSPLTVGSRYSSIWSPAQACRMLEGRATMYWRA